MPLFDFKQYVSEHLRIAGKNFQKKRGRPASNSSTPVSSRVATPTNDGSNTTPVKKGKKHVMRQDIPLNSVRTDTIGHFPSWKNCRFQCYNDCKFRSFVYCEKCKIYLCLNKDRNCFLAFHA